MLLSFIGYVAVYAVVFPAGFGVMRRIIRAGPRPQASDGPVQSGRPTNPIEALSGLLPTLLPGIVPVGAAE